MVNPGDIITFTTKRIALVLAVTRCAGLYDEKASHIKFLSDGEIREIVIHDITKNSSWSVLDVNS